MVIAASLRGKTIALGAMFPRTLTQRKNQRTGEDKMGCTAGGPSGTDCSNGINSLRLESLRLPMVCAWRCLGRQSPFKYVR